MSLRKYIILSVLILLGSAYLFFSHPVCHSYGTVTELEQTSGMPLEDFLTIQSEVVGNIIFNSPSWSSDGEEVHVCRSRIREMIPLH